MQQKQQQESKPLYDYTATIAYKNDEEYQTTLNLLLKMESQEHVSILDDLYLQTQNDPLLLKLYTLAAEKQLLQTDPEMGLILLFSYDIFRNYHALLQTYFTIIKPHTHHTQISDWNEDNQHYQKIHQYWNPTSK